MADAPTISTVDFEDSVNVDIQDALDGSSKSENNQRCTEIAADLPNKVEVEVKSCPVDFVTVFLDRAEVNRAVETRAKAGKNEIVVTGLSTVMDEDSIRVQCFGEATVIEVSVTEKIIKNEIKEETDPEASKNEATSLAIEKVENLKQKKQTEEKIEVLEKEKEFLLTYGARLGPTDKGVDNLVEAFDKKSLENVASFLEFFHGNCERLNGQIFALKEKIKTLGKEFDLINDRLMKLVPSRRVKSTHLDKRVSILLEAESETELKLVLSYVVLQASWTPLYDLRAFSKENKLQLLYFGTIKQLSEEDWDDAKLYLSTAMPSVGGAPPTLEAWNISSLSVNDYTMRQSLGAKLRRSMKTESMRDVYANDVESLPSSRAAALSCNKPSSRPYFKTEVHEGVTSTCFEIARRSTIKCDYTSHKVSICQINLSPTFEYTSIPKLVAHAFLKATVKNTSNYALLAGPASVFLDNNFLTKSYLDAVSPMEDFEVSLGVDAAVKITYKPLKKYQQRTGLVSKYTNTQYHQEIVVKNTKSSPVKITVTDALPKSSDEKIKVNLIEPSIPVAKHRADKAEENDKPIKMNEKNQVEWVLEIPPSGKKELSLKYNVEHPVNICVSGI